jgi:ribosomal-protein-alanine N-acetyltransferase
MPYAVKPVVDPKRLAGPQPEIEAGDLFLRRWTLGDASQLMAAFADREIQQWNLRTVESLPEARKVIGSWMGGWKRHTAVSWAVVRRDERDTVLGQVGFRALYPVDGMAEVSYWVVRGQRRQGVATRATRALADWAMDDLELERLELVHSTLNQASCRVALAAGFKAEGTKRHLQKHADGWHDMHLHGRIREDRPAPSTTVPLRSRLAARIERSVRVGDAGGRPALIG